jgi:hypothetical protein
LGKRGIGLSVQGFLWMIGAALAFAEGVALAARLLMA